MEDWLKILLGIVTLVGVFFADKKKVKQNPPPVNGDEYEDFDPIDEQKLEEEEVLETVETMRQSGAKKSEKIPKSPYREEAYSLESESYEKLNHHDVLSKKSAPISYYSDEINDLEEENDFDLEQAVLYSEILKRPYS